jgi:hypothetical protein
LFTESKNTGGFSFTWVIYLHLQILFLGNLGGEEIHALLYAVFNVQVETRIFDAFLTRITASSNLGNHNHVSPEILINGIHSLPVI